MQETLSQLEDFVKNCCQHRPNGARFVFLGLDPSELDSIEELNKKYEVEYYDQYFARNLSATYLDHSLDLVYIHRIDHSRDPIEAIYQWGSKLKGGGAIAGWGYNDRAIKASLLRIIGDCPSRWPDIWALPIVVP